MPNERKPFPKQPEPLILRQHAPTHYEVVEGTEQLQKFEALLRERVGIHLQQIGSDARHPWTISFCEVGQHIQDCDSDQL